MLLNANVIYRIPATGEAAAAKVIQVHDCQCVDLIFWRSSMTEFAPDVKQGDEPGQWQYPILILHDEHGRPVYEEKGTPQ